MLLGEEQKEETNSETSALDFILWTLTLSNETLLQMKDDFLKAYLEQQDSLEVLYVSDPVREACPFKNG